MGLRDLYVQYNKFWKVCLLLIISLYVIVALLIATASYFWKFSYGDAFSFGQLLMDMVLLPVVIVGFIITIQEFRKSQDIPDLDFVWEIAPGKFDKTIRLAGQKHIDQGARPVIINTGKAVAVWYIVQFDVPKKLIADIGGIVDGLPLAARWIGHAGNQENWRIDIFEDFFRIIFTSNGKVASYPHYPLPLGILNLVSNKDQEETQWHQIHYIITTDQGMSRDKNPLTITLIGKS